MRKIFDFKIAGPHNPKALNYAVAIACWNLGFRVLEETYNIHLGDLKVDLRDGVKFLTIRLVNST